VDVYNCVDNGQPLDRSRRRRRWRRRGRRRRRRKRQRRKDVVHNFRMVLAKFKTCMFPHFCF
jgi:hypothetical protein